MAMIARLLALLLVAFVIATPLPSGAQENTSDAYTQDEIMMAAKGFFGATTQGLAEVIEKIFKDLGQPNAYVTGEEVSGAFAVGLRYGNGWLHRKTGTNTRLYWQGPSIGWDFGGNAAKVFTLVYDLGGTEEIFQRFPGVEGSIYVIGGLGVNYQRSGEIVLAPIRTGVGLRAGANVGYLHYSREHSWIPF